MKLNKLFMGFVSLSAITAPLTLTSCSFFNNWFSQNDSSARIKNDNFKFISERTVSLRFHGDVDSALYGTGWMFAKENVDQTDTNYYDDNYYIATNLHVASAFQNRNKTIYEYDTDSNSYVQKKGLNYSKLDLGYIISKNDGKNYSLGTYYDSESISNTKYLTTLDLDTSVSLAYTSFDLFNQMQLEDVNKVYGNTYFENATSDIAIFKVNFKNPVSNIKYQGVDALKQLLDIYNANPTKFGTFSTSDKITIAGFPYKKMGESETSLGAGTWSTSYHPKPHYLSTDLNNNPQNISTGIIFGNESNKHWKDGIYESSNETIKKDYALLSAISFKTDNYASYFNVALQATYNYVNLSGGSSGSMAINDKKEVVGIYWGGYSYDNGLEIGAIDVFNNTREYKDNNGKIVIKPYNIIENFKTKVQNTNL